MSAQAALLERVDEAVVLTKAALRAADALGMAQKELAQIIGVSPAYITKLKAGNASLALGSKQAELAVILIRIYRSLDAIVGGDAATARAWLRNENTALGAVPMAHMASVTGLIDTAGYLDQRRALV